MGGGSVCVYAMTSGQPFRPQGTAGLWDHMGILPKDVRESLADLHTYTKHSRNKCH